MISCEFESTNCPTVANFFSIYEKGIVGELANKLLVCSITNRCVKTTISIKHSKLAKISTAVERLEKLIKKRIKQHGQLSEIANPHKLVIEIENV